MTAYDASEWSELFVASAGASAALAGLVFVAVSINVERILEFPGLPERALETGGGLYWTVAGILFATGGAVANAWVLLVEILR